MTKGVKYFFMNVNEDFSRITFRLKPYEQEAFKALVTKIRDRAGYDVPATDIVKNLMGFKSKLAALSEEDRALLRPPPVVKKAKAS